MSDLQPPATVVVASEAPAPAPRSRRGLWIGLIAGGVALVLLLVAGAIAIASIVAQRTPSAATARFLDALIAGDDTAALGMLDGAPGGPGYFTAEGVYAGATDIITDYRILGDRRSGGETIVRVDITQGGEVYTATVPLVKTGSDFGLLDRWAVSPDVLPKARIINPRPAGMGLLINGVDTPAFTGGTQFDLRALPGTYTLEATGDSDLYGAEPVAAPLLLGVPDNVDIDISILLTDAGRAAAQQAVDAQLDACVAQATPTPGPGCGFAVTGTEGTTFTSQSWTINSRPTVTFGPYDGSAVLSAGWSVVADESGTLTFVGSTANSSGEATLSNVKQGGVIVFRDGTAEFISGFTE